MSKMDYKMVALCAAAVGVIYSSGYFITEPHNANGAQSLSRPIVSVAQANPLQGNSKLTPSVSKKTGTSSTQANIGPKTQPSTGSNPSSSSSSNTHTGSTSTPSAPKSLYRDGTYYGQGYNRIGGIQVAVTIKQGKIVSSDITQCTTHYRQGAIDPVLPDQVLARQSANIDFVSGATRSSEDFQAAVQQALQQAMA